MPGNNSDNTLEDKTRPCFFFFFFLKREWFDFLWQFSEIYFRVSLKELAFCKRVFFCHTGSRHQKNYNLQIKDFALKSPADFKSILEKKKKKKKDGQTISTFSKSSSRKQWPIVAASVVFIACLVVEIIQRWIFAFADPLWPCIKIKVIETRTCADMPCRGLQSYRVWVP